MDTTTIENLKAARHMLVTYGVGRGALFTSKQPGGGVGQYCAMGAVTSAKLGIPGSELDALSANSMNPGNPYTANRGWPELNALAESILGPKKRPRSPGSVVFIFNDNSVLDGQPEKVIELFDSTIARLEEAQG